MTEKKKVTTKSREHESENRQWTCTFSNFFYINTINF